MVSSLMVSNVTPLTRTRPVGDPEDVIRAVSRLPAIRCVLRLSPVRFLIRSPARLRDSVTSACPAHSRRHPAVVLSTTHGSVIQANRLSHHEAVSAVAPITDLPRLQISPSRNTQRPSTARATQILHLSRLLSARPSTTIISSRIRIPSRLTMSSSRILFLNTSHGPVLSPSPIRKDKT